MPSELATTFPTVHDNKDCQVLKPTAPRHSRLALVLATKQALSRGLPGVDALEAM